MNDLAPIKNCPGVQGNLNWMPGYYKLQVLIPLFCLCASCFLLDTFQSQSFG